MEAAVPLVAGRAAGTLPPEALARLSGRELLSGILDGTFPPAPLPTALGFRLSEVSDGRARFEGTPSAGFLNPLGTVHGGWAASILDSALGCAVHSTCAAGETYTTLEIKVNLVRTMMPGVGPLVAEGRVRHRGGRTATAEGDLLDPDGRLVAHASTTCLIMPLPTRGG